MKLNKLIAALSAVTMIGSMALSFNASAENIVHTNAEYSAVTQLGAVSDPTYVTETNNGTRITLRGYGSEATNRTTAVFSLGTISDSAQTISVSVGLKLSNRDLVALGLYSTNSANSTYDECLDGNAIAPMGHLKSNANNVQGFPRSTSFTYNAETEQTDTTATTSSLDVTDKAGNLYLVVAVTGNSSRYVDISGITVDTVLSYDDTENISISADYTSRLYQNEVVKFTTTVAPINAEPATLSFTNVSNDDVSQYFTDNGDGSYTYNHTGRIGDEPGIVNVTATSGGKSATTTINTQRLRHISYKITDSSNDLPDMNVTAYANNTLAYTENVTYANEIADEDEQQMHKSDNRFSGHSQYSMTFTVPSGYKLTIDNNDNYTITETGNTVTITNGSNDLDNDFYITGTLTKESSTYTSDYFKFDYTSDTQLTFRTVTINAARGTETKEASAALTPEITLEEGAGGIFYMNVTNVPDDVTINSITLN